MLSDGNKDGKKNQVQHPFLHISLPLLLHDYSVDYSVKLPSSRFMKEMSYVVTKKCCLCSCSIFFLALDLAHFHLAGSQHFSFFDRRYKIFMFFFQRNSSSFVYFSFALTFSRSFIHVSEDKNLVNKKTRLCH